MTGRADPLAVMDAFLVAGAGQVCCGDTVGGGMDENGNGEPPQCCGQPFDTADLTAARNDVSALVEAARTLDSLYAESAAHGVDISHAIERLSDSLKPFGESP